MAFEPEQCPSSSGFLGAYQVVVPIDVLVLHKYLGGRGLEDLVTALEQLGGLFLVEKVVRHHAVEAIQVGKSVGLDCHRILEMLLVAFEAWKSDEQHAVGLEHAGNLVYCLPYLIAFGVVDDLEAEHGVEVVVWEVDVLHVAGEKDYGRVGQRLAGNVGGYLGNVQAYHPKAVFCKDFGVASGAAAQVEDFFDLVGRK